MRVWSFARRPPFGLQKEKQSKAKPSFCGDAILFWTLLFFTAPSPPPPCVICFFAGSPGRGCGAFFFSCPGAPSSTTTWARAWRRGSSPRRGRTWRRWRRTAAAAEIGFSRPRTLRAKGATTVFFFGGVLGVAFFLGFPNRKWKRELKRCFFPNS